MNHFRFCIQEKSRLTMVRTLLFGILVLMMALLMSCSSEGGAIANLFATETMTPTLTLTPSNTMTSTITLTTTPTATFTPSDTSTPTLNATATAEKIKTMTAGTTKTAKVETAQAKVAMWTTQTAEARCRRWNAISKDDVGKEMCVYGVVKEAWIDYQQWAFFMTFGYNYDDLYMVVYNGYYYEDVKNHCVQFWGEIKFLGDAPVFVINPSPGHLYYCEPNYDY